jgi:hypothetical protein
MMASGGGAAAPQQRGKSVLEMLTGKKWYNNYLTINI